MLILSGHGSGAVGDFLTDESAQNGTAQRVAFRGHGDARNVESDTAEPMLDDRKERGARRADYSWAGESVRSGSKEHGLKRGPLPLLDILGMDSCLMSTAEVCDEVRKHVAYLVASEGFVPNAGWPYRCLLNESRGRGAAPLRSCLPVRLSSWIVSRYIESYRSYCPPACRSTWPHATYRTSMNSEQRLRRLVDLLLPKLTAMLEARAAPDNVSPDDSAT